MRHTASSLPFHLLTYSQQSRGNHTYPVLSEGGVVAEETVGKTKKPFYKKWWFWAIVVLVVIAAASSGGGDDTNTAESPQTEPAATEPASGEAPEEEAPESEEPAEQVAKIGDALKVGDLVFTVNDAAMTTELKSPLGNKTGNWMVVTVTVKNESKEAVTIDSSFFKLLESDGTVYETDSDGLMYLDTNDNFFLEKINPKLEKQGKVLFAIPDGVTDLQLQVQTGAFGMEKGIISLSQ